MLFRTLSKKDFRTLVDRILQSNEIIGPKLVGSTADGKPIHQYLPVQNFDEIDLDYVKTEYSAKTYFLPYRETLSTCRLEKDDWKQEIRYRIQPRAIIGLHACDINALVKLDKVFAKDFFPNPYYTSRRKNTFIVGLDHMPCEDGFCRSLGTDTVSRGFDLYLTDLGDRYFVAIDSARGLNVIQQVDAKDISEQDTTEYLEARKKIVAGFKTEVPVHNLHNLLDIEFTSKVWDVWGEKCLSCGSCAMACPTCYCYGVSERVSMDSEISGGALLIVRGSRFRAGNGVRVLEG